MQRFFNPLSKYSMVQFLHESAWPPQKCELDSNLIVRKNEDLGKIQIQFSMGQHFRAHVSTASSKTQPIHRVTTRIL